MKPNDLISPAYGRPKDMWTVMVVILAAGVAYAPLLETLFRQSTHTHQALNGLILLSIALADAMRTLWRNKVPFHIQMTREGIVLLSGSAFCLLIASFQEIWPFAILAFCLNLAAIFAFLFGRQGLRAFTPTLVAFGLAALILLLSPKLDGILRLVAARLSTSLLDLVGVGVQPLLRVRPMEVVLVVDEGKHVFNVVAECNGFGLVFSSVLLATVLSVHGKRSVASLVYGVLVGLVVGVLFNALRIMAVIMTALRTSWDYNAIHEGWGTAIYTLALLLVFILTSQRSGPSPIFDRPPVRGTD